MTSILTGKCKEEAEKQKICIIKNIIACELVQKRTASDGFVDMCTNGTFYLYISLPCQKSSECQSGSY